MKKGELTRERIIEQTAPLFNQLGFFGASLSDVMKATGLKKGGIYNHFESKEDLALAAFDYASACVSKRTTEVLATKTNAVDKLIAVAETFYDNLVNPPIAGGCPLMNTAIESDDAHPALRERVRQAMDRYRARIENIVIAGVANNDLKPNIDPQVVSTRFISALEGGNMLSRLYGDTVHLRRAVDFLTDYVRCQLAS